jgi:hypothetical protein
MSDSNDTSSDEAVSQFLAITGSSDAAQAQSYLEMSANDLQNAITLFFEHQHGGGMGGFGSSGGGGGTNAASGAGASNDIIQEGSNLLGDDVRAPDVTRKMCLMDPEGPTGNLMAGVGGGNDMGGIMNHPILGPHAAALMRGGADATGSANVSTMSAFAEDDHGMRRMGARNSTMYDAEASMGRNVRDMINASAAIGSNIRSSSQESVGNRSDDDVQIMGETGGAYAAGAGTYNQQTPRLSDLFSEPLHLTHTAGGFQGARNVAKDSRRWLLVNLQSDSDFACHALNRDVWRNEFVENLVRAGFVFWQSNHVTPDGRTYAQRYDVNAYPHIGIIDPRTARLMYHKEGWTQENPMTAENFAEIAIDFCSRNSFDKPPSIPKKNASNPTASDTSTSTSQNSHAAPPPAVERMTEEEQLQAAIRASMNDFDQDDMSCEESDNDDVEMIDSDDDDDEKLAADVDDAADEVKEVTFHDEIVSMDVGEEPSGTDGVARIMIRMPDGKRLVRKFKVDDSVKMVYAFVSQSNDDAQNGKEFELKAGFPPKNLLPKVDDTIKNSGLAGDSVTVRWTED